MSTRIAAIDPGDVHVGVCYWVDGAPLDMFETTPDQICNRLELFRPHTIVLESFHLRPEKAKAQTYSKMSTPELIGKITVTAGYIGANIILQQPSLRKVAFVSPFWKNYIKNNGKPKSRHAVDAMGHAFYYHHFNRKNPRFIIKACEACGQRVEWSKLRDGRCRNCQPFNEDFSL